MRWPVWGPAKTDTGSLSFFRLHTALRKRDLALEACKEPPQPFSHCPLSVEKTAFLFSFLSLKMNSTINTIPYNSFSTDPSEKDRKRERWPKLCVFNQSVLPRSGNVDICGHLSRSILYFYSAVFACL